MAARGGLTLWLLIPATVVGAMIGDNVAYGLGRRIGEPLVDRVARGHTAKRRVQWAERAIRSHGAAVIIAGRFLPGGRSSSTLAAGTARLP